MNNPAKDIINEILEQHGRLRGPFSALQTTKNALAFSHPDDFSSCLEYVRKSLDSFDAEMRQHLKNEEAVFSKAFNGDSAQKVLADHSEIRAALDLAERALKQAENEPPGEKDLVKRKNQIVEAITEVYTCVFDHYAKEDTLLRVRLKELEREA
jgi:iron-sulfur cluster repair protein YtfE (RIC family)